MTRIPRIVMLGDSNSTKTIDASSYANLLEGRLDAEFHHQARPGYTSTFGLNRVKAELSDQELGADLVHMMFGTVDVRPGSIYHPYIIQEANHFGNLVSMIQAFAPHTKFVISAPQIDLEADAVQVLYLERYARAVVDIERLFPERVTVGAWQILDEPDHYISDLKHFSAFGHAMMAIAVEARLRDALPWLCSL